MGTVIIVGPWPPPIGGNSIHIERLSNRCRDEGIAVKVLDPYSKRTGNEPSWVVRFPGSAWWRITRMIVCLLVNNYDVVHVHVSAMDRFIVAGWIICLATLKARKRLVTIHSGSFCSKLSSWGYVRRRLTRFLLGFFHEIITVNETQRVVLVETLNIPCERVRKIPSFIPARPSDKPLPGAIEKIRRCAIVAVGSGYATSLYAHHILVSAIELLQNRGFDIGLILAVYTQYEQPYFRQIEEKVQCLKNAIIVKDLDSGAFNTILRLADIYVRTSRLDGDCIAIREALFNGCCVVASDCVQRPEGCLTFVTDSVESLAGVIEDAISGQGCESRRPRVEVDYAAEVIRLYQS